MEKVPLVAGDKYTPELFAFDPDYAQTKLTMAQILARAQAQVDALTMVSTVVMRVCMGGAASGSQLDVLNVHFIGGEGRDLPACSCLFPPEERVVLNCSARLKM